YYFDNILGPFKSFMNKALDRVETLDIDMICPGHGPVHDTGLKELFETYRAWSKVENPNENKTVIIAYVSAYGYTAAMAKTIADAISAQGIAVRTYDLVTDNCEKLSDDLLYADGILLGSPTILGDALKPIYDLTTSMLPIVHGGKQAAAFGSYGWTGEAVPNLTQRLQQLKMKVSDGLRLRFKPSEEELEQCRAFGEDFAGKVKG
ncbi:MAG: FprA family A-type flavoprotein, partial [Acutalibacter sp.]|nr:FprA family A-type flavoprotein [Acutalibacter sp.]